MILIGYAYLSIPSLLVLGFCLCLPVILVVILYNRTTLNHGMDPIGFINDETEEASVSDSVFSNLYRYSYSESEDIFYKDCSICLESFYKNDELVQLNCPNEHTYHSSCLQKWLKVNPVCPICKSSVA